jgi:hypothetical protein
MGCSTWYCGGGDAHHFFVLRHDAATRQRAQAEAGARRERHQFVGASRFSSSTRLRTPMMLG